MTRPNLVERVTALAALLEPTRRGLYEYVVGKTTAVSRDQAADAMGVTRAMAAFHLDKLVESGLLRAEYRRLTARVGRGAGRPSKLYRRSRHRFDVTLPPRDHELLARLLTESLDPARAGESPQEVAREYGRSLGVRARNKLSSRDDRRRFRRCVQDVMGELGFDPVADGPQIHARNCPFDPLSRRYPAVVCQTALAVVSGVIDGVGAESLAPRYDPRPDRCCVVLPLD